MKKYTHAEIDKAQSCWSFCTDPDCIEDDRVVDARMNGHFIIASEAEAETKRLTTERDTVSINYIAVHSELTTVRKELADAQRKLTKTKSDLEVKNTQLNNVVETNARLRTELAGVRQELTNTQRGIIGRAWAYDSYFITGVRFKQLEEAELDRDNIAFSLADGVNAKNRAQELLTISRSIRDNQQKIISDLLEKNTNLTKTVDDLTGRKNYLFTIKQAQRETIMGQRYAIQRMVAAVGAFDGEDAVRVAQNLRDERASYKFIIKNIREALGLTEISSGYKVIAVAKAMREQHDRFKTALVKIRGAFILCVDGEAWRIADAAVKSEINPQLAKGENEAAQTTRAAAIGCCE